MSITFPRGFLASATAAGIKPSGALDLSLVLAAAPVPTAAVFTQNAAAAPPVDLSRRHMAASGGRVRGVILNSGCANAATGPRGARAARGMASAAAEAVNCRPAEVLVCSTGPIGPHLPMQKIVPAVAQLADQVSDTPEAARRAADGILTTDTFRKEKSADGPFRVGGMAKGAGMIRPKMATMLAVVTTDARVSPKRLQEVLRQVADETFNSINIDGCESTNDTVILMASGASGVEPSTEDLTEAVRLVCAGLARDIIVDAEESTRVITLRVRGATDSGSARRMGMAIADSDLVRCSFYGGDPNWGRLVAALGACGEKLEASRIGIAYQGIPVASNGMFTGVDLTAVEAELKEDFTVEITVGEGPGAAEILTCDLTPGYVTYNGEPS